ncbi:MAG: hypothetical protein BAJATHORv1_20391 [Candidatus Thorarchaeota archaeon]|nr:MAG: hypothetical protein BAJATHORv1_20391 [Candidatus Thorarchaeota archaeon]
MDEDGFKTYLTERKSSEEIISEAIKLMRQFELFLQTNYNESISIDNATGEDAEKFVKKLIDEGENSLENLVTIARYGYFSRNERLYVSMLELVDGSDVGEVLFQKIGEALGESKRDLLFIDTEIPPLGTPSKDKPKFTKNIMERMETELDTTTCQKILSEVAHGIPKDHYKKEREKFIEAGSLDEYLKRKRKQNISTLEKHREEGTLFFNQEITDEVLEYVMSRPDVLTGERRGDVIYHTKIPFLAHKYLKEKDPQMKRYYACHCAWVRETILQDDMDISPNFCYCSGGFTKQPWEVAFGQNLEVRMVKSVLQGDTECAFELPIPDEFLEESGE